MSQGLITGALWGVLAAGFGLAVVSQVAPPPDAAVVAVVPKVPESVAKPALAGAPEVVATADLPVPQAPAKPAAPAVAAAPETAAPVADMATADHAPAGPVAPAVAANSDTPVPVQKVATADQLPVAPSVAPPEPAVLPEVAEADAKAATPARPSILKKPDPLPATPPLVAKGQVPPADPLPGIAPDIPVQMEVAAAPAMPEAPAVEKAPKVPEAPASADRVLPPVPPRVETAAPEAVAALPQSSVAPVRPASASAPSATARPATVATAGPPPVGPSRPLREPAPTRVVTEAPRAMLPAASPEDESSGLAVAARAGFEPALLSPAPPPMAADAPPATGLLPPPPPLTPEELAILAGEDAVPADPALPEVVGLTEAEEPAAPSILKRAAPLKPVPSLAAKGQVPATESLPTVTADPAPDAAVRAEPVILPDDAPPIDRFARPFDNAAGKPLFAVVLIDTGEPQIDRAALAAMPFPVTFALDPSAPESALAASIYRAAGQEVVMLATGLPEGATAADVEVSFGAHEAALPEAVAVLDLEAGGFQADRPLSSLVVPVLAGQGRGLLSWDRGLNAASQVARREGLRSGVIFRRLDGEGEPAAQIRRYLDRAAFKAAQDGRVIVAGETRPETVAALLEWAVEGRASTVALAPLTAALRVE